MFTLTFNSPLITKISTALSNTIKIKNQIKIHTLNFLTKQHKKLKKKKETFFVCVTQLIEIETQKPKLKPYQQCR